MAISKVVYKSSANATPVTWIDATPSTATADKVISGFSAMLADGVVTQGTGSAGTSAITGSITPASNGTQTISFGQTFSRYFYLIEMTDASKTELANSGNTNSRSYAFIGFYPSPGISNNAPGNCMTPYRVKPSTAEYVYSQSAMNYATGSSISIGAAALSGGANYLYVGYSYNYTIIPLD